MSKLSQAKKDELNALTDRYGLRRSDHFWTDTRGFTIVNRSGIEKIQTQLNVRVQYEVVSDLCHDQQVVILARAEIVPRGPKGSEADGPPNRVETFGESSPKNNRNAYPVAMAEKRALSRAVLKLSGMYTAGAFGEDEISRTKGDDNDDNKKFNL
jgi:hypothetical protein